LPFPGEEGGGDASLVAHDFSHVLAGYEPEPPSEVALQAMLTSANGFDHHFSGLIASLSLFETGTFEIMDITPKMGVLDRAGAAAELGDAFWRGSQCTRDFSGLDHLARVDEPLEDVRRACGIPPRA
jgi:ubiquinone biosynthesis protein Coq4